jgi:hypothetical protein
MRTVLCVRLCGSTCPPLHHTNPLPASTDGFCLPLPSLHRPSPDIHVRLLLSINRQAGLEEAEATVQLAVEMQERGVVGVDLTGNPTQGEVGGAMSGVCGCNGGNASCAFCWFVWLAEQCGMGEGHELRETKHQQWQHPPRQSRMVRPAAMRRLWAGLPAGSRCHATVHAASAQLRGPLAIGADLKPPGCSMCSQRHRAPMNLSLGP